ncbi:hypothetical protein FocTR4_00013515 [Fusarium oxysporum f. sp. cubense]|nr:hypothetical protein FocTR4_00013515 [Fusarium oxysporum f. sp. cubense]
MDQMGGQKATDSKYAARRREGENILAVGFAVQILFLILFMAISGIFQHRAAKGLPLRSCSPAINWRKYLLVNHIANMFILVRSIYHLIGYGQGYNGELRSTKAYFYAFDALLMLVVSVIFNIFHPLTYVNEAKNRTDSQIPLAYTNGVPLALSSQVVNTNLAGFQAVEKGPKAGPWYLDFQNGFAKDNNDTNIRGDIRNGIISPESGSVDTSFVIGVYPWRESLLVLKDEHHKSRNAIRAWPRSTTTAR